MEDKEVKDIKREELITVMTANVGGQKWMGFPERADIAAGIFNSTDADLVGFQEFTDDAHEAFRKWDKLKEEAEEQLGPVSGFKYIMGKKKREDSEIYNNTIAYDSNRFEKICDETLWFHPDNIPEEVKDASIGRAMTIAEFNDLVVGGDLLMVNMHLDHVGVESRIYSIEFLINYLNEHYSKLPTIITADSNVSISSPHPKWRDEYMIKPYQMMLEAGFHDAWLMGEPNQLKIVNGKTLPKLLQRPMTYHEFRGEDYRLSMDKFGTWDTEWIFVRGFKSLNCNVIRDSDCGRYPSDHYWMKALLKYE